MASRREWTIVLGHRGAKAICAKAMALGVAEAQEGLAGQGLLPDLPGTVPALRVRLASS